jgi:hypothetical protein
MNADWNAQQAELEDRQRDAAVDLLAALSPDQLFAFVSTITMHHTLGIAISRTLAPDEAKHALMKRGLLAGVTTEADVGLGILAGLKVQAGDDGEAWVRALWCQAITEAWGDEAEVRIVHYLSPTELTWSEIEARSASLTEAYWRTLSAYRIPEGADAAYAVDHLLAVGRSRDALGWLGHAIQTKPSGALVVRVMRAAAHSEETADGNDATMLSHWAGIRSGTPQLAGRARAIGPEKHTHTMTPVTAPTADLLPPGALPLGQPLQVRARRVNALHGVRQLPPSLLLGGLRRLANLGGQGVRRQPEGRVRLHGREAFSKSSKRWGVVWRRGRQTFQHRAELSDLGPEPLERLGRRVLGLDPVGLVLRHRSS